MGVFAAGWQAGAGEDRRPCPGALVVGSLHCLPSLPVRFSTAASAAVDFFRARRTVSAPTPISTSNVTAREHRREQQSEETP